MALNNDVSLGKLVANVLFLASLVTSYEKISTGNSSCAMKVLAPSEPAVCTPVKLSPGPPESHNKIPLSCQALHGPGDQHQGFVQGHLTGWCSTHIS